MKICLSANELTLDDLNENQRRIVAAMKDAKSREADLILFGEASLSGFDAMTFRYKEDIYRCLGISGIEISSLREAAEKIGIAVGFGFYENYKGGIYSSYVVIDGDGNIVEHYRRVSPGWKTPEACADYREGNEFHAFRLGDKQFGMMICGDFWEEDLLQGPVSLDPVVDFFLWPVHCDYPLDLWQKREAEAYRKRSAIMAKPILMINNYVPGEDRAKGGLYYWRQGRELAALPMGELGVLDIEI